MGPNDNKLALVQVMAYVNQCWFIVIWTPAYHHDQCTLHYLSYYTRSRIWISVAQTARQKRGTFRQPYICSLNMLKRIRVLPNFLWGNKICHKQYELEHKSLSWSRSQSSMVFSKESYPMQRRNTSTQELWNLTDTSTKFHPGRHQEFCAPSSIGINFTTNWNLLPLILRCIIPWNTTWTHTVVFFKSNQTYMYYSRQFDKS